MGYAPVVAVTTSFVSSRDDPPKSSPTPGAAPSPSFELSLHDSDSCIESSFLFFIFSRNDFPHYPTSPGAVPPSPLELFSQESDVRIETSFSFFSSYDSPHFSASAGIGPSLRPERSLQDSGMRISPSFLFFYFFLAIILQIPHYHHVLDHPHPLSYLLRTVICVLLHYTPLYPRQSLLILTLNIIICISYANMRC